MLNYITVKNFALIEYIELSFDQGLNIITGETGAGKSLLLGSVNAVLGARLGKEIIGPYGEETFIETVFSTVQESIIEKLKSYGLESTDNQIILSRKITKDGKSIYRINGSTTTVKIIGDIMGGMIDVHGQNEHHSLLNVSQHIKMLDAFCEKEAFSVKANLKTAYLEYDQLKTELEQQRMDEESRLKEIDFIQFEMNDIESANLKIGEDVTVQEQYTLLKHSDQIQKGLGAVIYLLEEQSMSASDLIVNAIDEMKRISKYDAQCLDYEEQIINVQVLLEDLSREMRNHLDLMDYDQESFAILEKRIDQINRLKSKYGAKVELILEYYDKCERRLDELENYARHMKDKKERIEALETKLLEWSEELTKIRDKTANEISAKINHNIKALHLENAEFAIMLTKKERFSSNGMDQVVFMVATNKGDKLQELSKVVSGGELSRIMLAIKTVLASYDEIETLIFDEIDTGISGRTAQKVAERLSVISNSHQTFCITHLPQIASMADYHYRIDKYDEADRTKTSVTMLDQSQMTEEIARLLGGAKITETVIKSANEMKALANETKAKLK